MSFVIQSVSEKVRELMELGLYREARVVEKVRGPYAVIDGREVLCFCSNDYLGLGQHPDLVAAAKAAAEEYGWGTSASRLLSGTTRWHHELEQKLAEFKRSEASLYFVSGYMANLALMTTLADRETLLMSDQYNHGSIVDGARLSGAKVDIYPHRDVDYVRDALRRETALRKRLVITDAVFSMDGDVAHIRRLLDVCQECDAELVIDDAHGTGTLGREGRGTLEHLGLEGHIRVAVATLSKAAGCAGGFITGPEDVIGYIRSRARTFIFTTAYPPSICAAGIVSIGLMQKRHDLREKLWRNVARVRDGLARMGFDPGDSPTPIIPIMIGSNDKTLKAAEYLWGRGLFCPAIRPPTVPEGTGRLRISLTAMHEPAHLDDLLQGIAEIKERIL